MMARGKYVHVLHSDDMVYPTFIEECVKLMENNPNVGFTVTEREEIDGEGNLLEPVPPFYNTSCIIPGISQKGVLTMASYYIPSQTVCKREVVERTGLYNISLFMDWWMLYACSCLSDMGVINKVLCKYRVWSRNESSYLTRNMLMPILGYFTRQEIFKYARWEKEEAILKRESESMYKQADLTLKLSVNVIREGEADLAKRYLYLALSQSEDIHKSELYKAINEYLKVEKVERLDIDEFLEKRGLVGKRTKSYDPPEGYKVYKI